MRVTGPRFTMKLPSPNGEWLVRSFLSPRSDSSGSSPATSRASASPYHWEQTCSSACKAVGSVCSRSSARTGSRAPTARPRKRSHGFASTAPGCFPVLEYHYRLYANGRPVWSLEVSLVIPVCVSLTAIAIFWRIRLGRWMPRLQSSRDDGLPNRDKHSNMRANTAD